MGNETSIAVLGTSKTPFLTPRLCTRTESTLRCGSSEALVDADVVDDGVSCDENIRCGFTEPTSGDVIYESDIGYSDTVLAPELIVKERLKIDGTPAAFS